jgi:hypothetical protein
MKSILASKPVVVLLLGAAMVALFPTGAAAQSITDWMNWMNRANQIGNQQAMQMYSLCINNPGACDGLANQQSLQSFINRLENQYQSNLTDSQRSFLRQFQATANANCAITGRTPYYDTYYNQWYCN